MIDWDRVNELKVEVGNDDFLDVVDLFLDEMDETMGTLVQETAPDLLLSQLHFIKGASLNIGFAELATRSGDGEKMLKSSLTASVDVTAMQTTYAESKRILTAYRETGVQAVAA